MAQHELTIQHILTIGGCQSCCDASEPRTVLIHGRLFICYSSHDVFRTSLTALLTEGLAAAAAPVKGGFIREALTTHYPRLAALLEETFRRVVQDTDVKFFSFCSALELHTQLFTTPDHELGLTPPLPPPNCLAAVGLPLLL